MRLNALNVLIELMLLTKTKLGIVCNRIEVVNKVYSGILFFILLNKRIAELFYIENI